MCKKIIAVLLLLSVNNFALASGYWTYDYATSSYVKKENVETPVVQEDNTSSTVYYNNVKKYDFPETDDYTYSNTYVGTNDYSKSNNDTYVGSYTVGTSDVNTVQTQSSEGTFADKHPILTGLGIGALLVGVAAVALLTDNDDDDYRNKPHNHRLPEHKPSYNHSSYNNHSSCMSH